MKRIMPLFLIILFLGGSSPITAEHGASGSRITYMEIVSVDISNITTVYEEHFKLYRYITSNRIDSNSSRTENPFNFSYFAINTTVEVWNGLPYESIYPYLIGYIWLVSSSPENSSYKFETSYNHISPFETVYYHGRYDYPPGFSYYSANFTQYIRVNQTGLDEIPKGTYVFQPAAPEKRLNTTLYVNETGYFYEYADRPLNWRDNFANNLPIVLNKEQWLVSVGVLQGIVLIILAVTVRKIILNHKKGKN